MRKKMIKGFQYFTMCPKCSATVLIRENIEERWVSSTGIARCSKVQCQKQVEEIQPTALFSFSANDVGLDEITGI